MNKNTLKDKLFILHGMLLGPSREDKFSYNLPNQLNDFSYKHLVKIRDCPESKPRKS